MGDNTMRHNLCWLSIYVLHQYNGNHFSLKGLIKHGENEYSGHCLCRNFELGLCTSATLSPQWVVDKHD